MEVWFACCVMSWLISCYVSLTTQSMSWPAEWRGKRSEILFSAGAIVELKEEDAFYHILEMV